MVRQHAEHATVVHGDRPGGAAGRRVPLPEAGDAEERQHVRLGAGLNFRGAHHQPSQGKRWPPPAPSCAPGPPPVVPFRRASGVRAFKS